jgi:hypothetical protein
MSKYRSEERTMSRKALFYLGKEYIVMTIGQYIKERQPITYAKLMAMIDKPIGLGEICGLMAHSAYKRVGRRWRQTRNG